MKNNLIKILLFLIILSIDNAIADQESENCECAKAPPLHTVNELLTCYKATPCKNYQFDLDVALREKGRGLAHAIRNYLELSNNNYLNENDRNQYLEKISRDHKLLDKIRKTVRLKGYDELVEPLYLDYDTIYKRYYRNYNSLNIGYEYVGLDKLFQTGFPRIGYLHYRRFGQAPAQKEGLGYYGLHLYGNMQLTSAATSVVESSKIQTTLVVTAGAFVPFYLANINLNRSLSDSTGVLINYSAEKISSRDHINSLVYAGFRNAFNPETYIDLLFGKSQGIKGSRIEIRAHLPVYKFENHSRIFFGGTLNMSPPWDVEESEPDLIRFYFEWNADFERIIEGVKSTVGL